MLTTFCLQSYYELTYLHKDATSLSSQHEQLYICTAKRLGLLSSAKPYESGDREEQTALSQLPEAMTSQSSRQDPNHDQQDLENWLSWTRGEKKKRLGWAIFVSL
jgi:hypothetical protein